MSWRDASATAAWGQLQEMTAAARDIRIGRLFKEDPRRSEWTHVEAEGLVFDFSRQRISREGFALLPRLADEVGLRERVEAMYRGDVLNSTERRQVLHTALRRPNAPYADVVATERERMLGFAEAVRNGTIRSSSGTAFELVVNIGIGGSDLGPSMAVEALKEFRKGVPRVAFASNVDGCRLMDVLADADPARTLFIVCSKTFTTQETLSNAGIARGWLAQHLGASAIPDHFAAVSVNAQAMDAFGIHRDYRFALWDWVGGRYSIWSSVGVALAVAIGRRHFLDFLHGAAAIDEHFRHAPWHRNIPALMGLIGIWNINVLNLPSLAVLPYDDRLARFPAYLQQLDMESNGKSVRSDGSPAFCETGAIVWGEPGNNAQHSFFQLLHQGVPRAALDFLLPAESSCGNTEAHKLAIANGLAQAEAFAYGRPSSGIVGESELIAHKVHEGNRPSSLLLFSRMDPATLGKLIALYEHKVFTQSVVWGINAFDQWGVELGKELARSIAPMVRGDQPADGPSLSATLVALRRLGLN